MEKGAMEEESIGERKRKEGVERKMRGRERG